MAEITASLVKSLRDQTGAGMMDCKKALTETGGNMDEAVDWLRTKGLAAAAKKAGRVAAEGLIAMSVIGGKGALVEVNSETDFVARNEDFQSFCAALAGIALTVDGDLEKLKAADYPGEGRNVEAELTEMIGKGIAYETCLAEAQRLGYAEADPTFDVDGVDSGHKLTLLSALAFDSWIDFESIPITGISRKLRMSQTMTSAADRCD